MDSNLIKDINKTIRAKEVAIFCGAGFSKNSGLPLANKLKEALLKEIFPSPEQKDDIDSIMSSRMPFEKFIECIKVGYSIDLNWSKSIFDDLLAKLFCDNQLVPNANHVLVAKLTRIGFIRTISTANYDLLFEKALERQQLRANYDFKTYSLPDDILKYFGFDPHFIDIFKRIPRISIFKIHGSADTDYLQANIESISNNFSTFKVNPIIDYIFSTGAHKKVLIIGYSCSDIFDVTPQLNNILKKRKEIYLIDHSDIDAIEDIKLQDYNNAFKQFNGLRIKCNTDTFVKNLWTSLNDVIGNYESTEPQIDSWNDYIHSWGHFLKDDFLINFIRGSLFMEVPHYGKAIEFFSKSLENTGKAENATRNLSCYMNLVDAYLYQGHYDKMMVFVKKAAEIYNKVSKNGNSSKIANIRVCSTMHKYNVLMFESVCNRKIGKASLLLLEGTAKEALEYFEKSLIIEKAAGFFLDGIFECYINMALCHSYLANYEKAFEDCNNAYKIAKENPFKKSACLASKGYILFKLNDLILAIESYTQSLEIDMLVGNRFGEMINCLNLGDVYEKLNQYSTSIDYLNKSLKIVSEIGAKLIESKCNGYLGFIYYTLHDFATSLNYHEKSLEIEKDLFFRPRKGVSYLNIGSVYAKMENYHKAIECYLSAEEFLKEDGQTKTLPELYKNISLAYTRIGDYDNAAKYKSKIV